MKIFCQQRSLEESCWTNLWLSSVDLMSKSFSFSFYLKIRIFLQHPHQEKEMLLQTYNGLVPCLEIWLHLKGVSRWPYCLVGYTWVIHLISRRAWQNPSHSTWSSAGWNQLGKGRGWFVLMTWKDWQYHRPISLRPDCKFSTLILHSSSSNFSKSAKSKSPPRNESPGVDDSDCMG